MTSTKRRRASLALAVVAVVAAGGAGASAQQPNGEQLLLRIVAVGEDTRARVGGEPSEVGGEYSIFEESPLVVEVEPSAAQPDQQRAIASVAQRGLAIVLDRTAAAVNLLPDGRIAVSLGADFVGSLDLYHDQPTPAVAVDVEGVGAAELGRASLRVSRAAAGGAVEFSAAGGRVTVVPAGASAVTLDAASMNRVAVGAGQAAGPTRDDGVFVRMSQLRRSIVQRSLIPDLVRLAEQTAEGDIEPPTRGTFLVVAAVAPEVRIAEIVPRGGSASRVAAAVSRVALQSRALSTAEQFIQQGDAALAVVGARLLRTRIVGATTGGGVPLAASPEVRQLFNIGRR